jgi:hypothetical protein
MQRISDPVLRRSKPHLDTREIVHSTGLGLTLTQQNDSL